MPPEQITQDKPGHAPPEESEPPRLPRGPIDLTLWYEATTLCDRLGLGEHTRRAVRTRLRSHAEAVVLGRSYSAPCKVFIEILRDLAAEEQNLEETRKTSKGTRKTSKGARKTSKRFS